jgi:hypothetical protein
MTITSEVDKTLNMILEIEPDEDYLRMENEGGLVNGNELVVVEEQLPCIVEEQLPCIVEEQLPCIVGTERDISFDYEYSRITHRDLIDKGSEALDGILKVAKESQHPRAYEVAGQMLKNISDMTDKLMVLQEKKKSLEANDKSPPNNITVEKAVFVGSTSELLKQVRQDKTK